MAKKTSGNKVATGVTAGLVAAGVAAAAGYYFYGSTKAKQHRKIAAKWANDMKKEVIRKAKQIKSIDSKAFANVVDTVTGTYRGVRSIDAADLKRAANELKSNWKMVQREIKVRGRAGVSSTRKVAKGAVRRGKQTVKKIVNKGKAGSNR